MTEPDRFELLERRLDRAERDLEALDERTREGPSPQTGSASATPEPMYGSVQEWVEQWFRLVFARPVGANQRWCLQWWNHAEAVGRLEVLWRSWETARLEPDALPGWWRLLDQHLPMLTDPQGTFAQCSPERHLELPALAVESVPAEWAVSESE